MRDAKNIAAVSALDVDMLGFVFYPQSNRYVTTIPNLSKAMMPNPKDDKPLNTDSATSHTKRIPKRVGVFVDEMAQNIVTSVYNFKLDYIQLHGQESPTFIRNLRATLTPDIQPNLKVIKAISIALREDLEQYKAYENDVDLFLFDTKTPLQEDCGQQFDWSLLQSYEGEVPFLLSGGIGPDDVSRIRSLHHPRMTGIDLNSKFETAPGMKDVVLLQDFIQALNSDSD